MPDITMCKGQPGCPLCKNCYRKNAKPTPMWQSYFTEPPAQKRHDRDYIHIRDYWHCEHYIRS